MFFFYPIWLYHKFVTYKETLYLCSKNEKQKQILTYIDFLLSMCFRVSWCFKTSLVPLQHAQWIFSIFSLYFSISAFSGKTYTYFFFFFVMFLFRGLEILQYNILWKNRALTMVVSSCIKLAKSDKHDSLPKFLPTTHTFLFHLSLRLPGNFKTRMQSVSGVSRTFQVVLSGNVSHFAFCKTWRCFWFQKVLQFCVKVWEIF